MVDDIQSESGQWPQFDEALAQIRRMPQRMWLNLVRSDQSTRWHRGRGVLAEDYIAALPELNRDSEDLLVLICGEVQVRSDSGENPTVAEYQNRFPELTNELALQFEINEVLDREAADSGPEEPDSAIPCLRGYQIEEVVGRGASSVVYRAIQSSP